MEQQQDKVTELIGSLKLAPRDEANTLLSLLAQLKAEVGNVMALREHRYMAEHQITELQDLLDHHRQDLNKVLLDLLQDEKAYHPYKQDIASIDDQLLTAEKKPPSWRHCNSALIPYVMIWHW